MQWIKPTSTILAGTRVRIRTDTGHPLGGAEGIVDRSASYILEGSQLDYRIGGEHLGTDYTWAKHDELFVEAD